MIFNLDFLCTAPLFWVTSHSDHDIQSAPETPVYRLRAQIGVLLILVSGFRAYLPAQSISRRKLCLSLRVLHCLENKAQSNSWSLGPPITSATRAGMLDSR